MTPGPTKIASKGACIYCGRSGLRLTDEHVVPLSLGGHHIIEDGSCDDCAKVTTKFEWDVGRELWGDGRIAYGAPSRRRKRRATHIQLHDPNNPAKRFRVPYDEYPAALVFYQMDKAGLLQGLPPDVDISSAWNLKAIMDDPKAEAFLKKYSVQPTMKFRHVPLSFGRLIAKVGYGQILCSLDPGDFRPICIPYIMGNAPNISFIVGGLRQIREPDPGLGYVLKSGGFGGGERLMLVAEVRLFANAHTPTYHVIVGDVTGAEKINYVVAKLRTSGVADVMPLQYGNVNAEDQAAHWLPSVWPLPFWIEREHLRKNPGH